MYLELVSTNRFITTNSSAGYRPSLMSLNEHKVATICILKIPNTYIKAYLKGFVNTQSIVLGEDSPIRWHCCTIPTLLSIEPYLLLNTMPHTLCRVWLGPVFIWALKMFWWFIHLSEVYIKESGITGMVYGGNIAENAWTEKSVSFSCKVQNKNVKVWRKKCHIEIRCLGCLIMCRVHQWFQHLT